MTMRVRVILAAMIVAMTLASVGCGHYVCGITKGATTCGNGGNNNKGSGNNSTGDAYLYQADAGGIQGMTFTESTGKFVNTCTPSTCPTVNDPRVGSWTVVAQGKYLYSGYAETGTIYGWIIAADGSLTNISGVYPLQLPTTIPEGGLQTMITNPAGTQLFMLNPTNQQILVYLIGSGGGLTQVGGAVQLPSGFQPYNMAVDGQGKYLYVSNIVGSATTAIQAYSIVSGSGTLNPIATFTTTSNPQFGLMQMQGDASGKFLVGTMSSLDNGDTHLYVLSIAADGTISPVTNTPILTTYPPDQVAVQPNAGGNLVYSAAIQGLTIGGPIEGFTLDLATGALTEISGSPFSAGADTLKFDQAGKFLFTGDVFSKDMSVFDVSTSSALTSSVASVGWGAGSWAPTDVP